MSKDPFVIERTFNASVEKVWRAISDKKQMKEWYFDLAEFKPKPGFEFSFRGGPKDQEYLHLCKVTAAIPNKKLSYTWRYDGYPGISEVTFELFPEGAKTKLRLTHTGLESFPATTNNVFAKENFARGWTDLIGKMLPDFLETNKE